MFEEIGSVDGKRKEFEDMIDRIHKGEFTDLLVYHPNRIYRAEYNKEKFDNIKVGEHNAKNPDNRG